MCGTNVNYYPVTERVNISTANPNLNGTGSITTLINGTNQGTIVKTITIKAQSTTSQGMVRLFLNNTSTNFLLQEVMIPAAVPTAVVETFSATINQSINLAPGYSLGVSTQNAETFSITAEGTSYNNCPCPS